MVKKNKEQFDFNELYNLYSYWDIDWWRILLYNNMDRFLTDSRINLDLSLWYWYDDIKNDLFIKIDEWISKSIDNWYSNKESFVYIRDRTRWFMLNSQDPKRNTENNVIPLSTIFSWDDEFGFEDESQEIRLWNYDDASLLHDAILSLSDKHKSIILLKYMSWDNYKISDIAKHIWKNQYETICEHEQALINIKDILQRYNQ